MQIPNICQTYWGQQVCQSIYKNAPINMDKGAFNADLSNFNLTLNPLAYIEPVWLHTESTTSKKDTIK